MAACAALAGAGIGLLWRPLRLAAAIAIVAAALSQTSPLSRDALLIAESQRDAPNAAGRAAVTNYLLAALRSQRTRRAHHDEHGVARALHARPRTRRVRHSQLPARGQRSGLAIRRARSQGLRRAGSRSRNVRKAATRLYQAWKRDERYLDGFERVAEGGGVALYRRRQLNSVLGSQVLRFVEVRRPKLRTANREPRTVEPRTENL